MTRESEGNLSVSITAGHIRATSQPQHPLIGQQVAMGNGDLHFHITPEIARQWVGVLEQIVAEE